MRRAFVGGLVVVLVLVVAAVAATGLRAIGVRTGTDYGPANTMQEAAAVEAKQRAAGGAYEPIRLQ